MVQEFHVVRCFSCEIFQSQQVKKVNKFACKLCGSKQSVRKEYGRGNGKDCRIHVQKLNNLKGEIDEKEEGMLESKLQEGDDLNIEYYDQEYNDSEEYQGDENYGQEYNCSEPYEGDEYFLDDRQYNDFQHESGFNGELSSVASVGRSKMNNHHTKEGRKSKWASYLSNETEKEEDEFTEIQGHFNPEEGHENYGDSQHTFGSGRQKNKIATNRPKKLKRDEGYPYQHPNARIKKSSHTDNSADNDKDMFIKKCNEFHTKQTVYPSTQRITNFDQNNIACSSITVNEKKTQFISLKENTQFKKEASRSMGASSEFKLSTNKIEKCFTKDNDAVYKEIFVESKPISSLSNIKKKFKPSFMTKVTGTQNVYNKFADAHELEDIL